MSFQDIMKTARSKSCWKLNDNMVAKSVTPPIETKEVLARAVMMKPPMSPKAKTSRRAPVPMSPKISPKMSPKMSPKTSPKMAPKMAPKNAPKMAPMMAPKPIKTKPTPKLTSKVPLPRKGSTTGPIGPNSDFSGGFYPIKTPKPKIEKQQIDPSPQLEQERNPYPWRNKPKVEDNYVPETCLKSDSMSSVSDWLASSPFENQPMTDDFCGGYPIDELKPELGTLDLQPRFEQHEYVYTPSAPPAAPSYDQKSWQKEVTPVAKDFCGAYPIEPPKPRIELDKKPIETLEPISFAPSTEFQQAKPFNWQTSFDLANVCHPKNVEASKGNSMAHSISKPSPSDHEKKEVSYPWRPQQKPMNSINRKPMKSINFNESPINLCEVNLTSLIDESTSCYASQLIADLEEKMKQKSVPVFQPVIFNPNGFGVPPSEGVNEQTGFQSENFENKPDGEQLEVTTGEEMTQRSSAEDHPSEEVIHPDAETIRRAPNNALTNEPDAMELAKERF